MGAITVTDESAINCIEAIAEQRGVSVGTAAASLIVTGFARLRALKRYGLTAKGKATMARTAKARQQRHRAKKKSNGAEVKESDR